MEFLIFCGTVYGVLHIAMMVEEYVNWMPNYRRIAKEQQFHSDCETCATEYHE